MEPSIISTVFLNLSYLILLGFTIFLVIKSIVQVEQQTVALVERFGKYHRPLTPGLNFIIPFIEKYGIINMRVFQLDVPVETKTKDNVFVRSSIAVQYSVIPERVYESFYKLNNVQQQISAYVFDSVRSIVPKMTLDEFFDKKDEIADNLKIELLSTMTDFGYNIDRALVTDIEPDAAVKTSMNLINAAERQKLANEQAGEAAKILVVKNAEGDAESKRLQGKGIADQRREILNGFQAAITEFKSEHTEIPTDEIMRLMLMTQYMDMLKHVGANNSVIMLPHGPGNMTSISNEFMAALQANTALDNKSKTFSAPQPNH